MSEQPGSRVVEDWLTHRAFEVTRGSGDAELAHEHVVLVFEDVGVEHVVPGEVAELADDGDRSPGRDVDGFLPLGLITGRGRAVDAQDLEVDVVQVDRVVFSGAVVERPLLRGAEGDLGVDPGRVIAEVVELPDGVVLGDVERTARGDIARAQRGV